MWIEKACNEREKKLKEKLKRAKALETVAEAGLRVNGIRKQEGFKKSLFYYSVQDSSDIIKTLKRKKGIFLKEG